MTISRLSEASLTFQDGLELASSRPGCASHSTPSAREDLAGFCATVLATTPDRFGPLRNPLSPLSATAKIISKYAAICDLLLFLSMVTLFVFIALGIQI